MTKCIRHFSHVATSDPAVDHTSILCTVIMQKRSGTLNYCHTWNQTMEMDL